MPRARALKWPVSPTGGGNGTWLYWPVSASPVATERRQRKAAHKPLPECNGAFKTGLLSVVVNAQADAQ